MAETSLIPAFDVAVVGAGLAGLAATAAFARAGFRVASVGPLERAAPSRTVALLGRSVDFLSELGALDAIKALAAPMRMLRIVDATGALFAPPPVEFRATEIGLDVFGWNIENAALTPILAEAAAAASRFPSIVARFAFDEDRARLTLSDGAELTARLVVGADGRGSPSRKAAGIDMTERRFGQTALTLRLRHSRPHGDASTEFHTREGPFTLVPLPPATDAAHRSSLVWLMREATAARLSRLGDAELAEQARRVARAMLGEMTIEGPRALFPMNVQRVARLTARRLALIGDAAHAFPPIGAQGLNLGLRDAAEIVTQAARARDQGGDIGGEAALEAYAAARRPDIAFRSAAVAALNGALLASFWPVDAVRGIGLGALGAFSPLRNLAMREGLSPFLAG